MKTKEKKSVGNQLQLDKKKEKLINNLSWGILIYCFIVAVFYNFGEAIGEYLYHINN